MKRRNCFAFILAAALLLCACSGTAAKPNAEYPDSRSEMTKWAVAERQLEFSPQTVEHGEDAVIQWADPAMEAHIRALLNKPEGDIRRSDVWEIQVLRVNSNGVDAAWTEPTEGETFNTSDSAKNASYLAEGGSFDNLTSLEDLRHFDSLQAFSYSSKVPYDGLTDLSGLESCPRLKVLSLHGAKPETLEPLSVLTELESLELYNCGTLDLTPLSGLKKLSRVFLIADNLVSLEPLADLPALYYLGIGTGTTYPSLEPLTRTKLEFLDMGVGMADQTTYKKLDYEPLTRMPALRYLDLTNHVGVTTTLCKQIAAGSPNLRGLDVSYTKAADHSVNLQDLGIEWLMDTPESFNPVKWWNRLMYWLA